MAWGLAALLLAWMGPAESAPQAAPHATVEVLDTWPRGTRIGIPPRQPFHLRLRYVTDAPVRIWARPYFQGREVPTTTHGSPLHEGSGETSGWFSLESGQRVDEVRISINDGPRQREVARHRVHVVVDPAAAFAEREPAWISDNRARNEERSRLDGLRQQDAPGGLLAALAVPVVVTAIPVAGLLGLVLPVLALRRWRGGWRLAAGLPLVALALVLLNIAIGIVRDPTSHNLWPFEILMVAAPGLAWIAALALARRFLRTRGRPRPAR